MRHWKFGIVASAGLISCVATLNAQSTNPQSSPGQSPGNSVAPSTQSPGTPGSGTVAPGGTITSIKAAIKCIHDIQLAAQADGLLQELLVEEGAAVEQGQLILTID